jgi:hypothetical protein|tara:strand:+ start:58 stop:738 length:681 start_codon:yes stop_codon:yes gene_type:complete
MSKSVNISGSKLPIEELHLSFLTNKLRTEYGFLESSKRNIPVNDKNEVMPMYTYPCYEWLNSIDWTNSKVFEYGTGYSTIWWQNKNVDYHAVEDNKQWYDMIEDKTNINYKPGLHKYIQSIYDYNYKFDVIVIDGVFRFDCIKPALDKIKNDGIIIVDNTDWHRNSKEELDKSDLIPIHFHGFKPLHVDSETTSCYINRKFNKKAKSIIPMAGTVREQHETDKSII